MKPSGVCGCRTPTLDRYLEKLPITQDDLSGRMILDIGAAGLYFAQEATLNYGAKIFSIDKDLSEASHRYALWVERANARRASIPELNALKYCLERSACTLAQALPFHDDIFDTVISISAIPLLLNSPRAILNSFQEAIRVTKSGGTAYFYPLAPVRRPEHRQKEQKRVYRALQQMLTREKGIRITLLPCEENDPIGSGLKIPTQLLIIEKY